MHTCCLYDYNKAATKTVIQDLQYEYFHSPTQPQHGQGITKQLSSLQQPQPLPHSLLRHNTGRHFRRATLLFPNQNTYAEEKYQSSDSPYFIYILHQEKTYFSILGLKKKVPISRKFFFICLCLDILIWCIGQRYFLFGM